MKVKDLTAQQREEMRRAIQAAADYIHADAATAAQENGERLTNVGLLDAAIDGLDTYCPQASQPSAETLVAWRSIDYPVRLRWARRNIRLV